MASQSLHQPSLPLSLADGTPPYHSPLRRSGSTARNDFELVPRWQRKDMEELPDDSSAAGSSSFSKSLGGSPSLTPGDSISNVGDNSILKEILKEVQVSNKKVASLEKQLQELREKDERATGRKSKKPAPSPEVRMMVRKLYKSFEDEDENFGWDFDLGIGHTSNQDVVKQIVAEAKAHLAGVSSAIIKDAVKTYYNSMANVRRLKANGKYKEKIVKQRKKNRISNKLKRRLTALAKTKALSDDKKKKVEGAFVTEMMSSEESEEEEEEDGSKSVSFTVRPLPWRNDKMTELFLNLDQKHTKKQSKKSTQMTLKRYMGEESTRPGVPTWCIKDTYLNRLQ